MTPSPKAPGYDEFVAAVEKTERTWARYSEVLRSGVRGSHAYGVQDEWGKARASLLAMWPGPGSGEAEAVKAKDNAYAERDRLVCALSKLFPAYLGLHPEADTAWEMDWRWIVYVELPTGQTSWHIHDSERSWFDHLRVRDRSHWDGHSTEEKYRRLEQLSGRPGSGVSAELLRAAQAAVGAALVRDDGATVTVTEATYQALLRLRDAIAAAEKQQAEKPGSQVEACRGCGQSIHAHFAPDQGGCSGDFRIDGVQVAPLAAREKPGSELVEAVRQMLGWTNALGGDRDCWMDGFGERVDALRTALAKHDAAEKAGEGGS